jgi:hypothetical protein
VVGDRDDTDRPECGPDRSIGVGLSSIAVPVQGSPGPSEKSLVVTVDCEYSPDAPDAHAFEAVIEVPTGVLVVGDKDARESLVVAPGLWRLFVVAYPMRHARRVAIRFSAG